MDYFCDDFWSIHVLLEWTFNGQTEILSFIKNFLICISKMNKRLHKKNPYNVKNNQPSIKTTTAIILM